MQVFPLRFDGLEQGWQDKLVRVCLSVVEDVFVHLYST